MDLKKIFITATNTEVGKTYTTLKLIKLFSQMGYKVGVFKPIETGVTTLPIDAKKLFDEALKYNDRLKDLTLKDIAPLCFQLPAAPIVANSMQEIDLKIIDESYQKIKQKCDLLLIEGLGGVASPINLNYYVSDLIKKFDAKALLVCDDKLGSINNALLAMEHLQRKEIDFIWAINQRDEEFNLISKPYFETKFQTSYYLNRNLDEIANSLLLQ
jgi:dethiobiotin synthetase